MIIPTIIEKTGRSERAYDIYSRLLKDRIVILSSDVDDTIASSICAQLLFLEAQDADKTINFYINSPSGSVTAGLATYDTMSFISCPISTVCMGQATSMGAFLLSSGTKGLRYSLPNSQIMIHQPSGGFRGQVTDIDIHARQSLYLKKRLNQMLAEHTGQTLRKVTQATERDNFLTADEALKFGIVDKILSSRSELAAENVDNKIQ